MCPDAVPFGAKEAVKWCDAGDCSAVYRELVDGQDVGSLVCCLKFDMEAAEG